MIKKESRRRPVFEIRYDPRLPSIPNIQAKHWRSMTSQDQYLKEVFPMTPLTAYKRQRNLRDLLIKSRLPNIPQQYPAGELKGVYKCGRNCTACPFIKQGITTNKTQTWNINKHLDCQSFNIIYLIECQKDRCQNRYIGETGRHFKFRLDEHRGYVNNQVLSQATGAHFNLPGHSLADLKATILEQVKYNDEEYSKERESYHIRIFNTYYNGLNRQK